MTSKFGKVKVLIRGAVKLLLFLIGLCTTLRVGYLFAKEDTNPWSIVDDIIISLLGSMLVPLLFFMMSLVIPSFWERIRNALSRLILDEKINSNQPSSEIESEFEKSINHIREVFIEVGDLNEISESLKKLEPLYGAEHVWDYHIHTKSSTADNQGYMKFFFESFDSFEPINTNTWKPDADNLYIAEISDTKVFFKQAASAVKRPELREIESMFDGILFKGTIQLAEPEFVPLDKLIVSPELRIQQIAFIYSIHGTGTLWQDPRESDVVSKLLHAIVAHIDKSRTLIKSGSPKTENQADAD